MGAMLLSALISSGIWVDSLPLIFHLSRHSHRLIDGPCHGHAHLTLPRHLEETIKDMTFSRMLLTVLTLQIDASSLTLRYQDACNPFSLKSVPK